jgi:Tol biopolymer transport system component
LTRLTRTRSIDEGNPSWDPSGQRLAFARGSTPSGFENGPFASPTRILQINADGSCETLMFPKQVRHNPYFGRDFAAPSWQPGPGREAGRILC